MHSKKQGCPFKTYLKVLKILCKGILCNVILPKLCQIESNVNSINCKVHSKFCTVYHILKLCRDLQNFDGDFIFKGAKAIFVFNIPSLELNLVIRS